jgi:tRNA(fMet)-specific endonuclease VapC
MTAFDTDILTGLLQGDPSLLLRAATIPSIEQTVPIIVVEEILRGRLETIRRAEAGKSKIPLEQAYLLFREALQDCLAFTILDYSTAAGVLFASWKKQRIPGSTHDLRIAAIAVAHAAKLVTRNRKDFQHIPGLNVEFWN